MSAKEPSTIPTMDLKTKTEIEHFAADIELEPFTDGASVVEYGEGLVEKWVEGLTERARESLSEHDIERAMDLVRWGIRTGARTAIEKWVERGEHERP